MIKRATILSILLIYVIVTAGFTVDTHFCGNRIAGVSFNSVKKSCGMEMNCCSDKHLDVKVSDQHQKVSNAVNLKPASFLLFYTSLHPALTEKYSVSQIDITTYHSPPLYSGIPLTIVNSVFRI